MSLGSGLSLVQPAIFSPYESMGFAPLNAAATLVNDTGFGTAGIKGNTSKMKARANFATGRRAYALIPVSYNVSGTQNGQTPLTEIMNFNALVSISGQVSVISFNGSSQVQGDYGYIRSDLFHIPAMAKGDVAIEFLGVWSSNANSNVIPALSTSIPYDSEGVENVASGGANPSRAKEANYAGLAVANGYGHRMVLMVEPQGQVRRVAVMGDSRGRADDGDSAPVINGMRDQTGWVAYAAFGKSVSVLNLCHSGARLYKLVANNCAWLQMQARIVKEAGISDIALLCDYNDITDSRTLQNLKDDYATFVSFWADRGVTVWPVVGIPSGATSSDSFQTTGLQTKYALNDSIRAPYHDWLRARAGSQIIDFSPDLETVLNSGIYKDSTLYNAGQIFTVANGGYTANTGRFYYQWTIGQTPGFGWHRNDLVKWGAATTTVALRGTVPNITNSGWASGAADDGYQSAFATLAGTPVNGDTFQLIERLSNDGVHQRTQRAQVAMGVRAAGSSFFG